MNCARSGRPLSDGAVRLLGVLVERSIRETLVSRAGFETLALDLACSTDKVGRLVAELEAAGAVEVRRFHGRGRAAEITFSGIMKAPNLDGFADKTPHRCGVSSPEKTPQTRTLSPDSRPNKTPQTGGENPANRRRKPRTGAGPTVTAITETDITENNGATGGLVLVAPGRLVPLGVRAVSVEVLPADGWPSDWPSRIVETWKPHGTVTHGQVGGALRGLKASRPFPEILLALESWLAAGRAKFGPVVFAREAGDWVGGAAGRGSRPSVGEQAIAAAVAWNRESAR